MSDLNASGPGPRADPVLIVDDHELVGSSVVLALHAGGIDAHSCRVTSTQGILQEADRIGPHGVVLLDLDLGLGSTGVRVDEIALIRGFSARRWRVLVVSAATDRRRVAAAVAAGAVGYVAKWAPLEDLVDTVSVAAAGGAVMSTAERTSWLALHQRESSAAHEVQAKLRRLTSRERQILELLARGERAAAIAETAVVSLTTVRSQIRSILTKLEVNSQLEAAALFRDEL